MRQRVRFQHNGAPAHYGEDRHRLNAVYSVRVEWTLMADCMVSSRPYVGLMDPPPPMWRHLRAHVSPFIPRTIEDVVAWLQAVCANGPCQCTKTCSRECCAAYCRLLWYGRKPLQAPTATTRISSDTFTFSWWHVCRNKHIFGHRLCCTALSHHLTRDRNYKQLTGEFLFTPAD